MSSTGRRFHLIERLGEGAFGEVYLADMDSDAGFRRRVAVKMLGADIPGRAEAGRRMRDEARILGRLHHKHIVLVLDLLQLGGQWAVVMDYVPGPDLQKVLAAIDIANERMPVRAALEMGAAIGDALDAAWTADDGEGGRLGVLHRDVKPGNVVLTPDADLKVLDFGVARVNLDSRESRTGARVGTERYMSPQRLVGDDDGLAGEVYALGATMLELLLVVELVRGSIDPGHHAGWIAEWSDRLRARLAGGPEDAVGELVALIASSLEYETPGRPSARAMADALARLARRFDDEDLAAFARRFVPRVAELTQVERRPIDWILTEGTISNDAIGPAPTTTPTPTPVPPAPTAAPARRRWWLALPVAAAVLLAAGLGMWGDRTAPPPIAPPLPVPVPEPIAVPQVAPPPVPAPTELATAAPTPPTGGLARPMPRAPRPAPAPMPLPPPVAPVAPAIEVSRALVVIPDAAAIRVRCGGVAAEGTTTARLTAFPAGLCRISADYQGSTVSADVAIEAPREVHCRISEAGLQCS